MNNINYSNQLNSAREGTLNSALRTAGALQGMRANEQAIGIQNEQHEAARAKGIAEAAEAEEFKAKTIEGAELLQSGTSGEVAKFMAANPKISKGMIDSAKFQNDESKMSRIKYAQDIIGGADAIALTEQRIADVERNGGDATALRRSLEAGDADAIRKTAEVDLAMLDPKGFLAYQKATGTTDKDKSMTDYQAAMVKGSEADRAIRKLEAQNKKAEIELKKIPEGVKKEKLQAEIDAKNQKLEQDKLKVIEKAKVKSEAAQAVVDSGDSTLALINEIENHPGFGGAVGMKDASHLYGVMDEPFAGSDESGVVALIETLEAQNFLTAIGEFKSAGGAGALSDNEGKKLGAALSSLNRAQGEGDFKKSLNIVRNLVKKQVSRAKKQVNNELSKSEAKQVSPEANQTTQALEWVKANPNDPRAAQIMAKIEGMNNG